MSDAHSGQSEGENIPRKNGNGNRTYDERSEAVRKIIEDRRRKRLEAQAARREADDREWGWSQQAAARNPLPKGLFSGAAARVLAGDAPSVPPLRSAETSPATSAPEAPVEISEQTKKELIDSGGPLMELELGKLAAEGVIRIDEAAPTTSEDGLSSDEHS